MSDEDVKIIDMDFLIGALHNDDAREHASEIMVKMVDVMIDLLPEHKKKTDGAFLIGEMFWTACLMPITISKTLEAHIGVHAKITAIMIGLAMEVQIRDMIKTIKEDLGISDIDSPTVTFEELFKNASTQKPN